MRIKGFTAFMWNPFNCQQKFQAHILLFWLQRKYVFSIGLKTRLFYSVSMFLIHIIIQLLWLQFINQAYKYYNQDAWSMIITLLMRKWDSILQPFPPLTSNFWVLSWKPTSCLPMSSWMSSPRSITDQQGVRLNSTK